MVGHESSQVFEKTSARSRKAGWLCEPWPLSPFVLCSMVPELCEQRNNLWVFCPETTIPTVKFTARVVLVSGQLPSWMLPITALTHLPLFTCNLLALPNSCSPLPPCLPSLPMPKPPPPSRS